MDNTTLHTFLFHCPAALRSLVLLGSWDNFTRPYSLELDKKRGPNFWRGCFTFSDIICEGDPKNLVPKRNGPLKMGGTYWYYYKVDDDDECHDPSEPSTTVCPLLPGQRLNVLELPSEGHTRSSSEPCDGFTLNPKDRYRNPEPPKPLSLRSFHLDTPDSDSHSLPLPSPWAPRSATFPQPDGFLSPNVVRHARSASASPHMPSTPMFADFRGLKDKLASKRTSSRSRSSSKSRELEIGSPVLVSSTVGDLNLVPLASYRPSATTALREASSTASSSRSIPTIRKQFSPLGSHPVQRDVVVGRTELAVEAPAPIRRRRSHVPSTIITSEFKLAQGRIRANSADTRRTQHYLFSNDPWLSSPKYENSVESFNDAADSPLPTLQRPARTLAPPERPTSSHGGSSPSLRLTPSDKDLPELPRYATSLACNNVPVELPAEDLLQEDDDEEEDDGVLSDIITEYEDQPHSQSHFSTWSTDSLRYNSDNSVIHSPTFSSLTSNDSDPDIPEYQSLHFMPHPQSSTDSAPPPRLEDLRISTPPRLADFAFGSDLFALDIQHADSAPRRQAACFGLGFQYSLPEDETTSKTTITQVAEPGVQVQRESSMSLMDEFGFLGGAVI